MSPDGVEYRFQDAWIKAIPARHFKYGPEPDQLVTALTNRKSRIQVVRLEFGESFLDAPAHAPPNAGE
jgi:hypothetical protein